MLQNKENSFSIYYDQQAVVEEYLNSRTNTMNFEYKINTIEKDGQKTTNITIQYTK